MGKALEGQARQGLPHDQGLHPRPRQGGGHAACSKIASPPEDRSPRPLAVPRGHLRQRPRPGSSPRAACWRRWTQARRQGKVRFVGFTGHKDPAIHLKMLSHGYPVRHRADAAELPSTRRFRSFEQRVLPEVKARHRGAGHEEHGRHRRDHPPGRGYARRSPAVRHEPSGRDHCLRHRLDGGPGARSRNRPRISATVCPGDGVTS